MAICSLCKKEKILLDSHIVPKFVFKWLKETGSEFLRNPTKPNQRIQDGIKEKLLCFECEQKISISEKWFSENIFHTFLSRYQIIFPYEEQLGRFVVSALWRIALVSKDNLANSDSGLQNQLAEATEEWREFLDSGSQPGSYNEFHLLLLPDGWDGHQPNKYVSRYFNRDTDGHIIELDEECWVYVKFARLMFFGRIAGSKTTFRNTKINLDRGCTVLGQYIEEPELSEYLVNRAEAIYEHALDKISDKQQEVILEYFKKNLNRIQSLDLGKRLQEDSTAEITGIIHDPTFRYVCDSCGKPMAEPEGYLLRTFEILLSPRFFKYYFQRIGLSTSEDHLDQRNLHAMHFAEQDSPWMICDDCIPMFNVDLNEAKRFTENWIMEKGVYSPPKAINFRDHLSEEQINQIALTMVTV